MGHSRHGHVSASWSKLPRKIIHNISKHLQTPQQLVRFKRVCRRWKNDSLLLPANILSFTLPLTTPISTPLPFHSSTHALTLQVSSIYLITPSQSQPSHAVSLKPWMIMVQESNPGKLRLRHPLTAKRVNHFPPTLDMSRFQAHELAQGYNFKHSDCVHKVLLCTSTSSSSLEATVLFREGILGKLTVKLPENQAQERKMKIDSDTEEEEEEERYSWKNLKVRAKHKYRFQYLDDVVEFKGKYYAIDRKGKLYELEMEAMMVGNELISDPICRGDVPGHRRKRLVVDHHATSAELYLVERKPLKVKTTSFEVYKFNEECKRWDAVHHLGSERVLFAGVDHCFFAKAKDFPGFTGNCIVFSANCFTQYVRRNAPDRSLFGYGNAEVGVYQFGKGNNFSLLSSAYPEFSKLIWPPPTWFSLKSECKDEETDSSSSSQQASDGGRSSSIQCLSDHHAEGILTDSSGESSSEEDNNEEILLDSSSSKTSKGSNTNEITDSDEDDEELQKSLSDEQTGNFEANVTAPPSPVEYEVHNVRASEMDIEKTEECAGQDFSKERVYNTNATPVTPSAKLPSFSPVKFEGVDIKSELLPTLQTIWSKQGNLIGEETVKTKDMRACALESLAKLVITLQNTTGKTLTETRAEEIKSTLFDLQRAGLKVDWLVPAVEKATNLQKNKESIESVERLNKRKAQVDEEEKAFLARTTKVKQEIEEDIACLSPFPEVIDLDDCLGRRLFLWMLDGFKHS